MADYIRVGPPCDIAMCMKVLILTSMILGFLVHTHIDIVRRIIKQYPNENNNMTSDALINSRQVSQENVHVYLRQLIDALQEELNETQQIYTMTGHTATRREVNHEESMPTRTMQQVPEPLAHVEIDTPSGTIQDVDDTAILTSQHGPGHLDHNETTTKTPQPASNMTGSNQSFPQFAPRDKNVLITMFTTFINSTSKEYVQSNTLMNWAQFQPKVRLILFSTFTTGPLIDLATELGWIVQAVPKVNEFGTPYLKEMYQAAMNMSQSYFYGYINGDILFTETLINTLQVLAEDVSVSTYACSMVTGIRTNVNIDPNSKTPFYKFTDIAKTTTARGTLFEEYAQDYFMMSCDRFPWETLPDLVIGRPAYDNYLVAMATKYHVQLIDATRTILALHQTDLEGLHAGSRHIDKGFNVKAIGSFDYNRGMVQCAPFYTRYDISQQIIQLILKPKHFICTKGIPYNISYLTKPMHSI